jgi:subtilisin-like proprotein convertase family protein
MKDVMMETPGVEPMSTAACKRVARAFLVGAVLVGLIGASGCGSSDDQQQQALCAGKVCQFGVCSPETGECVNEAACQSEADCLPGYECGAGNECVPTEACTSNTDCETGICDGEACVNPDSCESDEECVEGTYCGSDGTCQRDPCTQKECRRGVCERGTGECVSAESCTPDNEVYRCVEGEECANGSCYPYDEAVSEFCDSTECPRGVCSFEQRSCINATDCAGDDDNCLEGYFCNGSDRCQRDLCQRDEVECGDGGVCDPGTGQCENAESCSSHADCRSNPDHVCLEGTCTLVDAACGDAGGEGGCPGNQVCSIDREAMEASCVEADTCTTSVDCTGDRQCNGNRCIDPVQCRDDAFEPNDTADTATSFAEASKQGVLRGSLCPEDTDVATFDTTEMFGTADTGTLQVAVTIPDRDIGLGDLELALLDGSGSEVTSETLPANSDSGRVTVTTSLGSVEGGSYRVELSAGSEMKGAGVGYEMTVGLVEGSVRDACRNAEELEVQQRLEGTTADSASSGLGSSCTPADGDGETSNEKIYRLDLETSQRLSVEVVPEGAEDVSVSVRERCAESATEQACVDAQGEEGRETIVRNFGAGMHYLIVQTAAGSDGGDFEISVEELVETRCSDRSNYCKDGQTSMVCDVQGGGFTEVACDDGCHPSSGRCFPPEGNVCQDAPTETWRDSTNERSFDLLQFRDEYRLGSDSCLDADDPRTGGPDRAYKIELDPKQSVTVTAEFDNDVRGLLYLASECGKASESCVTSAQNSTDDPYREKLQYSNTGDQPQTVTLVVDTAAGQNYGTVDLEFEYPDVVCQPGSKVCTVDETVETCSEYGREYNQTDTCGVGCSSGVCDGETCAQPRDITQEAAREGGTRIFSSWDHFEDNYDSSCGELDGNTGGGDAVFRVDLDANHVLEATMSGDNTDVAMYVTSSCSSTDSCLASVETGGLEGSLSYAAPEDSGETVFLHADASGGSSGEFQLDVNTGELICTPDTVDGCNGSGDVAYCSSSGAQKLTYNCGTQGCTDGMCNDRESDYCFDAEDITSEARGASGVARTPNWPAFENNLQFDGCGISSAESQGPDAVYKVDLEGDETLNASLEGQLNGADSNLRLIEGCLEASSTCRKGATGSDEATLKYEATSAETLYLAGDFNESDPGGGYAFDATVRTRCSTTGATSCGTRDRIQHCTSEGLETPFGCTDCCGSAGGGYKQEGIAPIPITSPAWDEDSNPDPDPTTGATSTINVQGCSGSVSEVQVGPELTNSQYRHNLVMALESPSGTMVDLEDKADEFEDFDAFDGLNFYDRDYEPEEPLSAFNGESGNGDWKLHVARTGDFDSSFYRGTFASWSLLVACN